jgi:serine/threonine protein kinase
MSRDNYELTGQKIQGYTISKPIGQGKFSIVYRAENEQGLTFALKKIKVKIGICRFLIWRISVSGRSVCVR